MTSSSTLFLFVLCKCDHNLPHLAEGTPQAFVFWGVCGAVWACDSCSSGHSSRRRGQQTQTLGWTGVEQHDSPSANLQTVKPSCTFHTQSQKNEGHPLWFKIYNTMMLITTLKTENILYTIQYLIAFAVIQYTNELLSRLMFQKTPIKYSQNS